jgi:site-specific recombinase XerD
LATEQIVDIVDLSSDEDKSQVSPSLNVSDWDGLFQKFQLFLRGQRGLSENTSRIYLSDIDSFRRYLNQEGWSLTQMDRQVLRGYLAWLATSARRNDKDGYARVSIARKLTVLRSFYRFLVQEGLFRSSPVPTGRAFQMKVEKPLPIFLGKHETGRLLDAPDESNIMGVRDKAILEVLYSCGIRLAEIQGIDLPDLGLPKRQILVRGKGSKERWVLFGKPTEAALRRYLQESRPKLATGSTLALFLNRYGQRLSRRSIEKLVRRYAARAGLRDGVHPHTLRHTFASHMLEGDADLRVIQELLGHSSPTTTQIYTHITKQEARHAYLNCHPRAADPPSQE